MWVSLLFDSVFVYRLKGGGQVKITADFFGQIYSLSSVKTENIIFKIFGIH